MAFLQHSDSLFRVFVLSKILRALNWGALLDERRDLAATDLSPYTGSVRPYGKLSSCFTSSYGRPNTELLLRKLIVSSYQYARQAGLLNP